MLHDDKPVQTTTIPKILQVIKNEAVDFIWYVSGFSC